jgi:SAM-dependent methyltransferase
MTAPAPDPVKDAAVRQWTADPCGPKVGGEPGSAEYLEQIDLGRQHYAPWMTEVLAYERARGKEVLDVGCGQGIDLIRYAREGARVTGVDLTPRHAELALQHLGCVGAQGNVVVGDAEDLPFGDASFDLVSSNGVLHHTPDMLAALREIARVLRPGGRLVLIVYNRASLHYWLQQVLVQGIIRRQLFEEHGMLGVLSRGVERSSIGARPLVRVYSPRSVRTMLMDAGFVDTATCVRHLHSRDTYPTRLLKSFPRALEWLGQRVGWYVIGTGAVPLAVTRVRTAGE